MLRYAKAIVAFVTPLIMMTLAPLGITPETPTGDTIDLILTAIVTGLLVYAVPNKLQ